MNKSITIFLSALLFFMSCFGGNRSIHAAETLRFNSDNGLFALQFGSVDIVVPGFVFWKEGWNWSAPSISSKMESEGKYRIFGRNTDSSLVLTGTVSQSATTRLSWDLTLDERQKGQTSLWGGLSFKVDTSPFFEADKLPVPTIKSDRSGWQLVEPGTGVSIDVEFEPKPQSIVFERGRKAEIRVYFAPPGQSIGRKSFQMSVTVSDQGKILPPISELLSPVDTETWFDLAINPNTFPIDLSFLNDGERPAGKRGFLKAEDGRLVFEDGREARFWGTNITAKALFHTGLDDTCRQAKRLAKMGFNLVRLHHHDSNWVNPNIFGRSPRKNTLGIDPKSAEKIDRWIFCLKSQGIYTWLDLNVGRSFTALDGITHFPEIAKNNSAVKPSGFAYINKSIRHRMKEFSSQYLNHFNEYTNLKYKNEPSIAFLLITNENDFTHHGGNRLLPNKKVPIHNKLYMKEAEKFSKLHNLNFGKTWKSWQFGSSKLFLNQLEHQFNLEMIDHLRSIGVKSLIATTNHWGNMSAAGLPALSDGDVVDSHTYTQSNFLQANPRYKSNGTHWIAAAGVDGKPLTVSEWNVSPFPAFDRSALPPYLASVAALQQWNAVMQYAYTQSPPEENRTPDNWQFYNDPSLLPSMSAAALIYRAQHVRPANQTFVFAPTFNDTFNRQLTPKTSRTLRTLTEQSRLRTSLPVVKELPWIKPYAPHTEAKIVRNVNQDFASNGHLICADTGDYCRNWENGTFWIDNERSQLAAGWIGNKVFRLKNAEISAKTANAMIAVQSLDNKPLSKSLKILVSLAAQSVPMPQAQSRMLAEPVTGKITLKAQPSLKLYRVEADGRRKPMKANYRNGTYEIDLTTNIRSPWLILEKP